MRITLEYVLPDEIDKDLVGAVEIVHAKQQRENVVLGSSSFAISHYQKNPMSGLPGRSSVQVRLLELIETDPKKLKKRRRH